MRLERYFEMPETTHIGTAPDRAYYIPYSSREEAFAGIRERSDRLVLLSGDWQFRYYNNLREVEQDAASPDFAADFDTIPVPSCWQNHGYDSHQYSNRKYPFPYDPPYVPDENPCGLYRCGFSLTKEQISSKLFLNFEGVDCCYYLWINGTFVGYSEVAHSTSEFDVTEALREGGNTLCVLVLKWGSASYLEDQDKLRMSGIFRDVYLLLRTKEHIRDFFVHTTLNDDLSSATVSAQLELTGSPAVNCTLLGPDGSQLDSKAAENGAVEFTVSKPQLWNAEQPVLYRLVLEAAGEVIVQEVGIRRVEVKDGVVLLNGTAIKFRGVNRHDSDPYTGYAISEEQAMTDLRLMKEYNINAIRTSHYPNAPWFPQLCNRYGFYMIAEADLESHGVVDLFDGAQTKTFGLIVQDERFGPAILDREKKNVLRDKNNPSILIWSLGNESGYGPILEEAGRWCKAYDPARLLHYESSIYQTGGHKNDVSMIDLFSRMYASTKEVDDYFADPANHKPFVQCEYIHAMGNGPGDAEDYFQQIDKYPGFCGGFVWEWCDHGVYRGLSNDGRKMFSYGGDFGESFSDINFCMDGLVTPDRQTSTGLRNFGNVCRPARARLNVDGTITIRNLLDFTDLGDLLRIRCELSVDGEVTQTTVLDGIRIPAHSEAVVPTPFALPLEGQCWLNLFYEQKNDLPLTSAGHVLGHDQLELRAQPVVLSSAAEGEAVRILSEDEERIVVGNSRFRHDFNKLTGAFDSLVQGQNALLAEPMSFNIWRAPTDNDRQRERPGVEIRPRPRWEEAGYDRAKVKVYSAEAKVEGGAVTIRCHLSLTPVYLQKIIDIKAAWHIEKDGRITLTADCNRNTEMPYLPRFGLVLPLFGRYEQLEYVGNGPDESYLDMRQSSYMGKFRSTVGEQYVDYIRPQEHGSHCGCRRVSLTDGISTLQAVSTTPFSFNASHYTIEELMRTRHNYELQQSGKTMLCLDYKNSGVGSNACGPFLLEQYRLNEESFHWELQLQFFND